MTLSDEKKLIGELSECIVGAVYRHVLWEQTRELVRILLSRGTPRRATRRYWPVAQPVMV